MVKTMQRKRSIHSAPKDRCETLPYAVGTLIIVYLSLICDTEKE